MRRLGKLVADGSCDGLDEFGAIDGKGGAGSLVARKPDVAPIVICALGMWVCAAGLYARICHLSGKTWWILGIISLAAIVICSLALLRSPSAVMVLSVAFGCALGCLCVATSALGDERLIDAASREGVQTIHFHALEDARIGNFTANCLADAVCEDGRRFRVLVSLSGDDVPRFGDEFASRARLSVVGASEDEYLRRRGAVARVRVGSFVREEPHGFEKAPIFLRNRAIDLISGYEGPLEGRGVLAALVCGYRGLLDETSAYEDFKASGLAHIVAVSGAHLSIVVALVAALLRAFHLRLRTMATIQIAFVIAYLFVAGFPLSALRAAVMASCAISSNLFGRRPASLNALALCVIVFICIDASNAVSLSFALSAGSTAGIIVLSPLLGEWLVALVPRLPRFVSETLSLAFSAQLATMPLSVAVFSQMSLVAPLANVLVAPLFAFACAGGLALVVVGLALPLLSGACVAVASLASWILYFLAHCCSSIPYACVCASLPVVGALALSLFLLAILWLAWPHPSKGKLQIIGAAIPLSLLTLAFVLFRPHPTELIALDVGQGDAILLRSGGAAILVDTGNEEDMLKRALAREGVYHLDALIITHHDLDHYGAIQALSNVIEIDRILLSRDTYSCPCANCRALLENVGRCFGEGRCLALDCEDRFKVGEFSCEVVWPHAFSEEGGNSDSLCLYASVGSDSSFGSNSSKAPNDREATGVLLMGDAEEEVLEALLEEGVDPIDVLKLGHHGSRGSINAELAMRLGASLALISVGADNDYGHPASEPLVALDKAGTRVVRTDENGDITVEFEDGGVEVELMR